MEARDLALEAAQIVREVAHAFVGGPSVHVELIVQNRPVRGGVAGEVGRVALGAQARVAVEGDGAFALLQMMAEHQFVHPEIEIEVRHDALPVVFPPEVHAFFVVGIVGEFFKGFPNVLVEVIHGEGIAAVPAVPDGDAHFFPEFLPVFLSQRGRILGIDA